MPKRFINWANNNGGFISFISIIVAILLFSLSKLDNIHVVSNPLITNILAFLKYSVRIPIYLMIVVMIIFFFYLIRLKKAYRTQKVTSLFLVGHWINEWIIDGRSNFENCEIKEGGQYYINNQHRFNIVGFDYNYKTNEITFIKVSANPQENRVMKNILKLDNNNLLKGKENNYQIKYSRVVGINTPLKISDDFSEKIKNKTSKTNNVFFDVSNATLFYLKIFKEKIWKDGKSIGESGKGNIDLNNGCIIIEKNNIDGRVGAKITKYYLNGIEKSFIERNINLQKDRSFMVAFKARILDGAFKFRVFFKKYNQDVWIDKANGIWLVTNKEWKEYKVVLNVPANQDFDIWFDVLENEKLNSSLQIKDFLIIEG